MEKNIRDVKPTQLSKDLNEVKEIKALKKILNMMEPEKKKGFWENFWQRWTFSKLIALIVMASYVFSVMVSACFIQAGYADPMILLTAIDPVVMIVITGYFGKSGIENFKKLNRKKEKNEEFEYEHEDE